MNHSQLSHVMNPRIIFAILALSLTACASGVRNPKKTGVGLLERSESGSFETTGIESQDIAAVTDKMARSLLNFDPIDELDGPAVIHIQVENATRTPINTDLFIRSIQTKLVKAGQGKLSFIDRQYIMDDEKERNLKRTGAVTSSSDPNVQEFKGYDYRLQGELTDLTTKANGGISDYIQYNFWLVDARTNQMVWAEEYSTKKQAFLDSVY